jgi:DNA helicase TIP49 (TBP-interacting protein)
MRKYIAKDEEDLIKQIESDPELDKELEQEKLVKGHVVEIRYTGKVHKKAGAARKKSAASHS